MYFQVKLWYDTATQQLSVTVVGGFDLPPRPNGALRNPYAKLFLLPDKRYFNSISHLLSLQFRILDHLIIIITINNYFQADL